MMKFNCLKRAVSLTLSLAILSAVFVGCSKKVTVPTATSNDGTLVLAAPIKDNMVLQRDANDNIWGKANPGQKVSVSFDNQVKETTSDENGNWRVALDPMGANKVPKKLTIWSESNCQIIENVLVGEVWFASGQSNMDLRMNAIQSAEKLKSCYKADDKIIRMFTQKETQSKSAEQKIDVDSEWLVNSKVACEQMSATAYFFAEKLYDTLDVPVGVVLGACFGTAIEDWFDIADIKANKIPIQKYSQENCYNKYVYPVVPYTIKGVIWYQGEANSWTEDMGKLYTRLMTEMVKSWRTHFENENLPFIQVQLPRYEMPNDTSYQYLRVNQMNVGNKVDNFYTTVNMDTGEKNNIHPNDKDIVGRRLADMALNKIYGKTEFKATYPVLKSATMNGDKIELTFDNVEDGLEIKGDDQSTVQYLEYYEENAGDFVQAKNAVINGKDKIEITLNSPSDKAVYVRYANYPWMDSIPLYDKNGLPVSQFDRTAIK